MSLILHLDTSTQICSVALSSDGELLGIRESHEEKSHSRQLVVFISELLEENHIQASSLDAVAVSMGPGSYTGLRIGVSAAKGLAYGSQIALIAVRTLDSLVSGALQHLENNRAVAVDDTTILCPMVDARRMEVYTGLYSSAGKIIEAVSARIIDKNSFHERLEKGKLIFFGNGAKKCSKTITHPNAIFLDGIETSAAHMLPLAEKAWQEKSLEDIAYFEPFYLKDFIATVPKNKIFPDNRSATTTG